MTTVKKLHSETSFESKVLEYSDALHNFGLKLTRNTQDAEDLVQETIFRALKYRTYFEEGTNAKAWLFRIMQNLFINNYRKKSRAPQKLEIENTVIPPSHSISIDSQVYNAGLSDQLRMAVNSLDETLKTVLLLCDVEGFRYKEIAKIMDIPLGTVKTYIHKARKTVKIKIERHRQRELRLSA